MMQDGRKKKQVYHPVQGRAPSRGASYEQQRHSGRQQNAVKHKRRRRGNNILLYIMVMVVMLTVGVVLIFTVFFKIVTISTEGLTRYTDQEIIQSSGILVEQNMFRLDQTSIEQALTQKYSYLEEVEIKLKPADTVIIKVTEAQPVAALQQGENYLLVSANGRVLETSPNVPEGLLKVKGLKAMAITTGETLDGMLQKQREEAQALAKVLEADTEAVAKAKKDAYQLKNAVLVELGEQISMMKAFFAVLANQNMSGFDFIDLSDQYNISAGYQNRVTITLGTEADLEFKLEYVQAVLSQLEPGFEGKIDISNPDWGAGVREIDLAAQNMTPDEYAEYLFQKNGGGQPVVSSASGESSQPDGQVAVPEVQAPQAQTQVESSSQSSAEEDPDEDSTE